MSPQYLNFFNGVIQFFKSLITRICNKAMVTFLAKSNRKLSNLQYYTFLKIRFNNYVLKIMSNGKEDKFSIAKVNSRYTRYVLTSPSSVSLPRSFSD